MIKYIIILDTCDGLEELHFTDLGKYLKEKQKLRHNNIMFDTRVETNMKWKDEGRQIWLKHLISTQKF